MDNSKPITDWKNRGLRVGWQVRLANGRLGIVTWINNGQIAVKEKEQKNESEQQLRSA